MKEYIVPNLYNDLNLNTLPKVIKDEFFKLGFWYNKEIFINPYNSTISFDLDNEKVQFYTHSNANRFIESLIKEKRLLNKNYDALNYTQFQNIYVKEYGRGFYDGYTNYAKGLKDKQNEIFETNNNQRAYTVFSKVINRDFFEKKENYPFRSVLLNKEEQVRKKLNRDVDFAFVEKQDYYNSGYQSGEKYKAWELILHNPTLFEDIFKEQLVTPEIQEEVKENYTIIEDENLDLSNLPTFNIQQRYEIFKRLEFDNILQKLDTEKGSKDKLLALIMGISLTNARHLLNEKYKNKLTQEQKEHLEDFFFRKKIKL